MKDVFLFGGEFIFARQIVQFRGQSMVLVSERLNILLACYRATLADWCNEGRAMCHHVYVINACKRCRALRICFREGCCVAVAGFCVHI